MIRQLKFWLMGKYCPSFYFSMPASDDTELYEVCAIKIHGYWGHKRTVLKRKLVRGIKAAYVEARWLALKADLMNPNWLADCGIHYGFKKLKDVK